MFPVLSLIAGLPAAAQAVVANARPMIIASTGPNTLPSCYQDAYYGTYGSVRGSQQHVYLPTHECVNSSPSDLLVSVTNAPFVAKLGDAPSESRIVWVGPAGVQNAPTGLHGVAEAIASSYAQETTRLEARDQHVFATDRKADQPPVLLLHQTDSSMFITVPNAFLGMLDTVLPSHLVPVALPLQPYGPWGPDVPPERIEYLGNITKKLRFEPKLGKALEALDVDQLRRDVRYLTGEGPSGIESRHSFTDGARFAAKWIKSESA